MKPLLLCSTTLLLLLQPLLTFAADDPDLPKEVTALLPDYLKEFSKVKEPADKVLSQQAGKVATKLSAEGHADEAKLVTTQAGDKMAGRPVAEPHGQLATLFAQYDGALDKLAKPVRDKYALRADTLLKTYTGKDLGAVTALGEAKRVISGAAAPPTSATADSLPDGERAPRQLRLFKSVEKFQAWLQITEWSTDDGSNVISFPEPGKMKIVKPKETLTYKIEVPEIGVIQWKWSDGKVAKMKIEENLKQGKDSSNKAIKRTKPER